MKKDKDEKTGELIKLLTAIGEEKNPMIQMKMWVNEIGDYLEVVWQEGYARGHKAGKKAWVEQNKN